MKDPLGQAFETSQNHRNTLNVDFLSYSGMNIDFLSHKFRIFPYQSLIWQISPKAAIRKALHSIHCGIFAVAFVPAKIKLIHIPLEVFAGEFVECPVKASFEQCPNALYARKEGCSEELFEYISPQLCIISDKPIDEKIKILLLLTGIQIIVLVQKLLNLMELLILEK
jgi:hypothetical protein